MSHIISNIYIYINMHASGPMQLVFFFLNDFIAFIIQTFKLEVL